MSSLEDELRSKSEKCSFLAENDRDRLVAIFQSNSACFSDLVNVARLNPATDFRCSDLSGVNFSGSNLQGFNFAGANLSQTRWFGATWDQTTIVTDAKLDGAEGFSGYGGRERDSSKVFQEVQNVIDYLDQAPAGFFSVDEVGKIIYLNGTLAEWLDVDANETHSGTLRLTDIMSDDDSTVLLNTFISRAQAKTYYFDVQLIRRGGTTIPARLHHELTVAADGAPRASRTLVLTGTPEQRGDFDGSPTGRSTGELLAGGRRIPKPDEILNQLATAVAVFARDQRLTFYNTSYRALWSLEAGFLDQSPTDSAILYQLRTARKLPEQADFRQWMSELHDAYRAIEPKEHWWHLPDGRTLRVVTTPDSEGGVTYLFDDVTERLNLERRYGALSREQGETLDNLAEGVAVFASDGRLRLYNSAFARMWKLSPVSLDGEPHIEAVIDWCRPLHGDDQTWAALRGAITAIEHREPITCQLKRRDNSVVDCATLPLPDGGTLVTFQDVTDTVNVERALRERAEALEAADKLKDDFVHHVSYELRSPLANIIGFTQLLDDMSTGPLTDKQREYLGYITTSSAALLAIINDILDLATIDAGAMTLDLGSVDIRKTMEAAAEGIKARLKENDITLDIRIAPDVGTLTADERRVRQVLYNLLSNAIGFSPPGGTVTLSAERSNGSVVFSVTDNGPGIPAELQERVFDRFESQTIGSRQSGVGLGLSIVRSLVELHGGTVKVESNRTRGTVLSCVFPLERAA